MELLSARLTPPPEKLATYVMGWEREVVVQGGGQVLEAGARRSRRRKPRRDSAVRTVLTYARFCGMNAALHVLALPFHFGI